MAMFLQHIFSGNYKSSTPKTTTINFGGGSDESDDKNSSNKGNSSIDSMFLCTHIGSGIPCVDKRNLSQPPVQFILTKFVSPSPARIVTPTPTEQIHTAVPSVVPSPSSSTRQPSNLPNTIQSLAPVTIELSVPVTLQPSDDEASSSAPASQEPNPSFVHITGVPYDFESLIPVTNLPTDSESSSPMTDEPYDTYPPATIEPKESNVPETSEPQTESLNLPLPTTTVSQEPVSARPIAVSADTRSPPTSSTRPALTWIPILSFGKTINSSDSYLVVMLSNLLSMALLSLGS
jgi:hypothetical protein